MVLENAIDDFVEFLCILCPMDDTSVLLGGGRELIEVLVQMGNGMALDGRCLLSQLFPFVESLGHVVALCADCPKRGIMPLRIFLVLQELLCCFTM